MKRLLSGLPIVLVVLGVLSGVLFFVLFEAVDEEREASPTGEAAGNSYFTAQLMLEGLGLEAQSRYGLGELPPTNHVVLVLTPDNAQRVPLVSRLFAWVAAGGHLVVVPTEEQSDWDGLLELVAGEATEDTGRAGDETTTDPVLSGEGAKDTGHDGPGAPADQSPEDALLAAFGIELTNRWEGSDPLPVAVEPPGNTPVRQLKLHQAPLGVQWTGIEDLTEPSDLQIWPAHGKTLQRTVYAVAERDVGRGWVSVVADRTIFDNDSLADADHAVFLSDLVTARRVPTGALLVLTGDAPSIVGLVWRSAWPAVVALGACLAAWARRASQRFGPLVPSMTGERRSLMEHIDATGQFLWRQHAEATLLDSARRRLRRRLLRRHPDLAETEGEAYIKAVAERVGVLPGVAEAALAASPPLGDRRRFLVALRAIQALWSHP